VGQVRRAGLVLIALLLLACSDDDPGRGSGTTERSTTTEPTPSALALRGDGLGVVGLGASPDDAIAAVSAELGEPSVDTGWEPSAASHATCPGDRIRRVEWGGLILLFTDGKTDHGDGEHLFTWRVTGAPPPVATAEGLGYGATLRDAEQLYDDEVERVPAEEPFPSFLRISGGGGEITAYLDDTDTITNLEAGTGCGE
jgi:hypothetical protein